MLVFTILHSLDTRALVACADEIAVSQRELDRASSGSISSDKVVVGGNQTDQAPQSKTSVTLHTLVKRRLQPPQQP